MASVLRKKEGRREVSVEEGGGRSGLTHGGGEEKECAAVRVN